jgi:hypothetical protein
VGMGEKEREEGGARQLEMLYGHVLDIGQFGEGSLRWISVRTAPPSSGSPGVASILATSLYSFLSARDAEAVGSKSGVTSKPKSHSLFRFERTAQWVGDDAEEDSGTKLGSQFESVAAPTATVSVEPVGRSMLLGAVSSLLSRAKVPVSLEQGEMLERILELESSKKRLQNDLAQERQSLLEASNLQRRTQAAMKCQICLTNDVSHVLTPCGHTLCGPCSSQLPQQKCPYCRSRFSTAVKFFLEDVEEEAQV